jgi:hypothetical protein
MVQFYNLSFTSSIWGNKKTALPLKENAVLKNKLKQTTNYEKPLSVYLLSTQWLMYDYCSLIRK